MKTNMLKGHISVAESWSLGELVKAGWTEADLEWETLTENAVRALAGHKTAAGHEAAAGAVRIARATFDADDPRLGTALANHALCLAEGNGDNANRLLREAIAVWRGNGPWIEKMTAPRTARSSLFHLRMELRHRETYEQNWQVKWRAMADDVVQLLERVADPTPVEPERAAAALASWQRERPAMLNDTRKLLAAVRLLLV